MRPFFKDESFNFLTEIALGATYHQAADVGEVLSTAERIRNGDARSWVVSGPRPPGGWRRGARQRRRWPLAIRGLAVPAGVDVLLAGEFGGRRDG